MNEIFSQKVKCVARCCLLYHTHLIIGHGVMGFQNTGKQTVCMHISADKACVFVCWTMSKIIRKFFYCIMR